MADDRHLRIQLDGDLSVKLRNHGLATHESLVLGQARWLATKDGIK